MILFKKCWTERKTWRRMYLLYTWMLIFFDELLVIFIANWEFYGNAHSSCHQDLNSNKLKVLQPCSLLFLRVSNYKLLLTGGGHSSRSLQKMELVFWVFYLSWSTLQQLFLKNTSRTLIAKCHASTFGSNFSS